MSEALFGETSTDSSIPPWLAESAKGMLDRSEGAARTGYMPYFGPDVAALSPLERAAMENTAGAANAFGMASPQAGPAPQVQGVMDAAAAGEVPERIRNAYKRFLGREPDANGAAFWTENFNPETFEQDFMLGVQSQTDPLTGLPQAGQWGGVSGYSSAPVYATAKDALRRAQPGTYDFYNQFFVDPLTGAQAGYDVAQGNNQFGQQPPAAQGPGEYGAGPGGYQNGTPAAGLPGGYTGFGDMFDGGGPGQQGDTNQGLFGGVGNTVNGILGLF